MKADAVKSQANPVSGTKYEVLATAANVRIIQISAWVTWTVQPTPLEVHVTIDGQTHKFSIANPVSATGYDCVLTGTDAENAQGMELTSARACVHRAFLYEGRSVKVEVETTGGTVQNLDCRVKYQQW